MRRSLARWNEADFHCLRFNDHPRITVKNDKLVGIIEKYVKKGSKLHIEGKLETRKYQKDGSDRYMSEIVLYPHNGEIVLLDPKADEHPGDDLPPSRPAPNPKPGDPDVSL